ncbi:cold-shock protein [Trueperella bialowiezensis]|uniref:Cold shock-like protein n=1 Tax=Trueperella bialowiezensis TaxID=312285 RepID=A0A448PDT4_9ACTO|nr:cold shock domain-containing protein [Trueperella bialowiezensis]VEI13093.1 Cold shock-like protein [Trueperella bialowiezensis]
MPTGRVKFFDDKKGFGFITGDDGQEVYLPASAVPIGARLRSGTRVEYGVGETRRGPAALQVTVLEKTPSLAAANRRSPEDMVPIIEDLIKILDSASNSLRRGRYPDGGPRIARALRTLAEDFDV